MSTKPYNGWTNYATWRVKLELDNIAAMYAQWCARADDTLAFHEANQAHAVGDLAHQLEKYFEAINDELEGLSRDLLGAALGEVNWYEIAAALIDAAKERAAANA